MSGYSRQKLIMPKITRSLTMKRKSLDEQNFNSGKDLNFFKDRKRINIQFDSDNFKKPGTSIEKVKPSNIFPFASKVSGCGQSQRAGSWERRASLQKILKD